MSGITYRYFQDETDLELQYRFWIDITKALEYAWKPTSSPTIYHNNEIFNPKSRYFAFEGDRVIGYMSFTTSGKFVSLGYPWVKPGYEHIRDELWKRVFKTVLDEIQPDMIAQRFRSQWEEKISYFLSKGFEISHKNPIYGLRLTDQSFQWSSQNITHSSEFNLDRYMSYLEELGWTQEMVAQMREYYSSVNFDYEVVSDTIKIGVTLREDNGFSEIIALAKYQLTDELKEVINYTADLIKNDGGDILAITFENLYQAKPFAEIGFNHISDDVFVMMEPNTD